MSNDDPNRGPGADGGVRDGKAGNDHEYGGLASERSTAPDSASARPQRLAGLDKRPARSAGDAKGEGAEGTDRAPQDSPAGELARNEDADLAEVLEQVPVEERQELFQLAAQITSGKQSWSGLLPRPEDFSGYAKHVQERMMKWNDAWTIDESKRQDRLVEAEIRESKWSPWRSFVVVVLAMGAALYCGSLELNELGIAFIAAPVAVYATSQITRVFSASSRSGQKAE